LYLRFIQAVDRYSAHRCDHFIAISQTIKITNSKYLNIRPSKIDVIYRGRDVKKYSDIKEANWSAGKIVFIFVGRIVASKGHEYLIKAFRNLHTRYSETQLLLVGDGNHKVYCENLVAKLGLKEHVIFTGTRSDIPSLLEQSHCFVMPTQYEGLGTAMLEAMMASRPVLCSDIPVLKENVLEGTTGLTFHVNDAEDIERKMIWMLEHPLDALEMGRNGRLFATEKFNIQKIAGEYERLYNQFI
jgi:glycosyltransferase involved in cell wall biosynthesis